MNAIRTSLVIAAALLLGAPAQAQQPAPAPKVLLIVSGEGKLDAAGKTVRPGFEMEEFAQAWLVLRANGFQLDVASPAGGAVVADRHNPKEDLLQALAADPAAAAALATTRRTQDVRTGEHAAVFVIGGKGAMFDLLRDTALARLLGDHHERGGVLAAVCHGPAVFAGVKQADGRPLVAGRRVTGFTDEEETTFGKQWAKEYPFWLERRLREQGALWEEAPLMMPKVVVDDRLITGQNPFSTAHTAEALVRALGRTPAPRTVLKEEASMQLVQWWLAGEGTAARALLAADAQRYKLDLIAMLGYYQHAAAVDETGRRQAVGVMELAAPHVDHPSFRVGLAKAQAGLGNPGRARTLLQQVLITKPDDAAARKALEALADPKG